MTAQKNILVIFGITGDLAQRKLIPALTHMAAEDRLEGTKIIGISRRHVTVEEILADVPDTDKIQPLLEVLTVDVAKQEDYQLLKEAIALQKKEMGDDTHVVIYLSVPPHASLPIVESLGRAGINDKSVKLLLEKPFGVDLYSAEEAVTVTNTYFKEDQLYRIDHYLAKEMVQNIVAFRSNNAIFRNLWNREYIEKIDIISSEKIGIENRAGFYEQTGALRDVLQNHLMQLAALTIMDIPVNLSTQDIPERRLAALKAIEIIQADMFEEYVQRGQYDGYDQDVENPGSMTETFASVTFFSSDPKWKGVPIRLATGKNLHEQTTEIRIYFKQAHSKESNRLVLHIQPKEGIEIDLTAKKPGYEKDYDKVSLTFNYREQAGRPVEAYERVLVDALASDKSLFTSADEVLASWRILQPVQERWGFRTDDLKTYAPGMRIDDMLQ